MNLDLTDVACDWRADRDGINDAIADGEREAAQALEDGLKKYRKLCRDLGVDQDPDSLESAEVDLVANDDFEDHARDLFGEMSSSELADASWPWTCIDWARAASELQMDYTPVEFDGVTYWYPGV